MTGLYAMSNIFEKIRLSAYIFLSAIKNPYELHVIITLKNKFFKSLLALSNRPLNTHLQNSKFSLSVIKSGITQNYFENNKTIERIIICVTQQVVTY